MLRCSLFPAGLIMLSGGLVLAGPPGKDAQNLFYYFIKIDNFYPKFKISLSRIFHIYRVVSATKGVGPCGHYQGAPKILKGVYDIKIMILRTVEGTRRVFGDN